MYYALHAMGYRPWWKKYITTLQIAQFVGALSIILLPFFSYMLSTFKLANTDHCRGELSVALTGLGIIFSVSFGFVGGCFGCVFSILVAGVLKLLILVFLLFFVV